MQTEQQSLRAAAGQRFWQIDALRGLALLNMLVYHAMYDWVYIFGHASGWYDIWSTHCHVWQQYICWSFILLSGYSFTLSRRPLKNGLLTAACAVVLTVATAVAMPEEVIWFGVLHLLGCAALLTCLLHPALEKLPPLAGVTGSAVLFALLNQLPQGWLGFEGTHLAALPAAWYKPNLFWLGLPDLRCFPHRIISRFCRGCFCIGWGTFLRGGSAPAAPRSPACRPKPCAPCAPWAAARC